MKFIAYSRIRVKKTRRVQRNNRWLQLSWRASGTYLFRLLLDTISEKNQKLKIEFPETTCVAFKNNLEKT